TKYRKRGRPDAGPSIPGQALIRDLATMAETLSRKAGLTVAELDEPSKSHVEVAAELRVSTKTVRRWRDRGLMGIRVVCDDGVNRLAFLRRTIDRFVEQHRGLVERGAAFKQLSHAEREMIVQKARELAATKPLRLHAAAKLISAETGRAVETVRYTLRRYDEANKAAAIFTRPNEGFCERDAAIWRCREAGEAVEAIARAFDCGVDEIETVLRRVQVAKWTTTPLDYVHNEIFDAPNADTIILDVDEPVTEDATPPRIPSDLPPYLRSLYLTPLLSREQEQDLFRRYNYLKFKASRVLKVLHDRPVTCERFDALSELMDRIETLRQQIIRANLRLVVSIAKRHIGWSAEFFEVISDGNMSLMRAVEKFDYARGNKFSTYASWAIIKNYARSIPEQRYYLNRYVTGQDAVLETAADSTAASTSLTDRRRVQEMIADGLNQLEEREREIVACHFGLGNTEGGQTLEQIGERYGVTKERVRQIERRALARLREILAPSLVDTLDA
ncbi:MAG: sigma-70 family RNA polymerase sigma factor, partial [Phycisphaerales bacterium]|nr:sigma-70 family RNA polymerase sigma factor [Phycisphaerales bacterium]